MITKTRSTLAALVVITSIGAAQAQTTQGQDPHHPAGQNTSQAQTPMPTPGQHPMGGGPGGAGMMMGGDMGQMMGMMQQMMRGSMMRGDTMPMGMGMGGGQPLRHIEGQLAFYKAELHITDAQLPQWNAFADVVRTNAKRLQQTTMPPSQGTGMPALPDQLERRVSRLSAMLEAARAVSEAAKPLYAALTPEQKKTADELMAEHMAAMRMRGL
ncbi:MAG: Spy/CpxP family protein refolding chaperone [Gammaproteobacteria bacterium]